MKNVKWRSAAAVMITVSMLCGCSGQRAGSQGPGEIVMSQDTAETETITVGTAGSISEGSTSGDSSFSIGARPMLISMIPDDADDVEASVERYEVLTDLGNVENGEQFNDDRDKTNLLVQNGFVVHGPAGDEFYEIYKSNQYSMTPNFITVDSLMHTYHLFFKHLFKNVEQYSLSNYVLQLSQRMRDNSTVQYELLKGSEWESAAQRNVAFFTVGAKLLDEGTPVNKDVEDIVRYEFEQIARAEENVMSELTGEAEDYSRYKPRGYYVKDEGLGAYFRAMMWYGGIQFKQDNEDLDRSALLIAKALDGDGEAYRLWEAVYAATSFFAGACDDLGVCEYMPVIRQAYGEAMEVEDLIGNTEAFSKFRSLAAKLPVPVTNSLSILDEEDNGCRS